MGQGVGKQWRKKQEKGSGVLSPTCSILILGPGCMLTATTLLHRQPGEGSQKEKIHGSCDSHTGHLGGRWRSPLRSALDTTQLDPRTRLGILVQIGVRGRALSLVPSGSFFPGICSPPGQGHHQQITVGGETERPPMLCWSQSLQAGCPPCWPLPTHWS